MDGYVILFSIIIIVMEIKASKKRKSNKIDVEAVNEAYKKGFEDGVKSLSGDMVNE